MHYGWLSHFQVLIFASYFRGCQRRRMGCVVTSSNGGCALKNINLTFWISHGHGRWLLDGRQRRQEVTWCSGWICPFLWSISNWRYGRMVSENSMRLCSCRDLEVPPVSWELTMRNDPMPQAAGAGRWGWPGRWRCKYHSWQSTFVQSLSGTGNL